MSRKSKQRQQNQPVTARIYVFVVADPRTKEQLSVTAPIFYMLARRGWAVQSQIESRRDRKTGEVTEVRTAKLAAWLSFRSLSASPDGNLCFRSLLQTDGVSIDSSWRRIKREWILAGFPYSVCPQTWQEKLAQQQERQAAILGECRNWGIPEPEPQRTGYYLSPETAALAIAERQARG